MEQPLTLKDLSFTFLKRELPNLSDVSVDLEEIINQIYENESMLITSEKMYRGSKLYVTYLGLYNFNTVESIFEKHSIDKANLVFPQIQDIFGLKEEETTLIYEITSFNSVEN